MATCVSYNVALVTILCKLVFNQLTQVGVQNYSIDMMLFHCTARLVARVWGGYCNWSITYFESRLRVLLHMISYVFSLFLRVCSRFLALLPTHPQSLTTDCNLPPMVNECCVCVCVWWPGEQSGVCPRLACEAARIDPAALWPSLGVHVS